MDCYGKKISMDYSWRGMHITNVLIFQYPTTMDECLWHIVIDQQRANSIKETFQNNLQLNKAFPNAENPRTPQNSNSCSVTPQWFQGDGKRPHFFQSFHLRSAEGVCGKTKSNH